MNIFKKMYRSVVGPSAIMTAGIMGAGSTTSLLLAGAYFDYQLLWIAVFTLPIVVVCQDTAFRIGTVAGGRGMMEIIARELHPLLMWMILIPACISGFMANIGQLGAMYDSVVTVGLEIFKSAPPRNELSTARLIIYLVLVALTIASMMRGGFRRTEKWMSWMLFAIAICFFIVAAEALIHLDQLKKLFVGLLPSIPADVAVPGSSPAVVRSGVNYMAAIAGGAVALTAILSYPYFTVQAGYLTKDIPLAFKKNFWSFGVIFGIYSVVILIAGAYRLHSYPGYLIENTGQAGEVLTQILGTNILGPVGIVAFCVGLFLCGYTTLVVVAQLISYLILDALGVNWTFERRNKPSFAIFCVWIILPAIAALFWKIPDLFKVVFAMIFNSLITPLAVIIIIYLINRRELMGEYRASPWRNIFLTYGLIVTVWVAYQVFASKLPAFLGLLK